MLDVTVTLRLPATSAAPFAARHGVVEGLRLRGDLAMQTALLVSEAVTNSVLHAGLAEGEEVHIDAWWIGDLLRVEVCDEGGGFASPSPAGERDGGRGLDIIGQLAERWGVHSDGHTRIWFELAG